nr:MAG TPA: hypothetical protein [Caudoviricetes sp.]
MQKSDCVRIFLKSQSKTLIQEKPSLCMNMMNILSV